MPAQAFTPALFVPVHSPDRTLPASLPARIGRVRDGAGV